MIAEKTNYELLSELVSNHSKVEEILNHYSQNFLMITRATFKDFRNLGLTSKEALRMISALEIFKRAYTQTNIRKISNRCFKKVRIISTRKFANKKRFNNIIFG